MSQRSTPEGIGLVEDLVSLEDRHRSVSFEELRETVVAGDSEAWRIFVEKYSRFVYTVALRLLWGPEEKKQEHAQEIYCRVFSLIQRRDFQVLRRFQSKCRFTTYLFRMVQTARSDVLRLAGREAERTDFVDFSDEANRALEATLADRAGSGRSLPGLSADRLRAEVRRILEGMASREKLIVRLRFQKGLKLREIARLLGLRDTNDAAYALKKCLKHFEPLAALEEGEWTEEDLRLALDVLDEELFQE